MYIGRHRTFIVGREACLSYAVKATRPASGTCTSVMARSFRDPHEVLGVSHDADDEEVKKAYKKLALRLHPDVNKEELAEAKFRALRDAYELLMGKGDPAREKNAPFGGNWEFHDWYWSFSMRQRQRRQSSSTCGHSSAAAQQHRPRVNSQLSNLKSRAKRRQAQRDAAGESFAGASGPRAASGDPSPEVEAPTQANHPQVTQHSPAPPEASTAIPYQHARSLEEDLLASDSSGQRTTSTVHSASHLFDPLNLFNSHSSSFPAHSSLYSTLEEEFHELQRRRSWSHADAGHHAPSSHLHQSSLDVGFWGSLAQHISFARQGFLQDTINRHNVCMQSATKHVVELVAGVGSNVHVGLSQHFAGMLHPERHTHTDSEGSVSSVKDQFTGIGDTVHARATAEQMYRGEAAQRVTRSVAPGKSESPLEPEADSTSSTQEQSGRSPSQGRFVSTEERRSAVRSQLAGLRRKARMNAP